MKALLHLKDGKNEIVELLIDISEKLGDINEFVNAAYTNSYYKGKPESGRLNWTNSAHKICSAFLGESLYVFNISICH